MGKVGAIELYTQSDGWVEIDLYDPADFNYTPLELYTASGWGVPFVTDPGSADTPVELYTQSNGWQGINSTGYIVLDNFEDGDLSEWVESQDAGVDVTSGRAAFQGNYGLLLDASTCERIVSAPTFTNPLPEYPSQGERWDSFLRFDDSAAFNSDLWHKFGCQTYPSANGFNSKSTTDGYVAEIDPNDNFIRIRKDEDTDGDGLTDDYTFYPKASFDPVLDQWYRLEIDWHYSTTSDIIMTIYEVTTDDWEGTQVAQATASSETEYTEGAISCAADDGVHWDLLRRTAPL